PARLWRESSSGGLGRARESRWDLEQLRQAEEGAERVAEAAVDAVRALGWPLGELDALRPHRLVGLPAIVGREEQGPAGRAFRHQLAGLLGGTFVEAWRAGPLQQDLAGIARHLHRPPAHEAQILIGVHFEAELADVEVERLVLVENVERRDQKSLEHG